MGFFISDMVAAAGAPVQGSLVPLILMLVVFGLIFYLATLRLWQKRTKERRSLIDSVTEGDEVLTNDDLVGRMTKIIESGYTAIALNDATRVVIRHGFAAAVLSEGTMKAL